MSDIAPTPETPTDAEVEASVPVDPTVTATPEVATLQPEAIISTPTPDSSVPTTTETSSTTDIAVTPPSIPTPEVPATPVATQGDTNPTPDVQLPIGFFHDTREVEAAERLGVATPAGVPLSSAARETLRGIEDSLAVVETAIREIRRILDAMPS